MYFVCVCAIKPIHTTTNNEKKNSPIDKHLYNTHTHTNKYTNTHTFSVKDNGQQQFKAKGMSMSIKDILVQKQQQHKQTLYRFHIPRIKTNNKESKKIGKTRKNTHNNKKIDKKSRL